MGVRCKKLCGFSRPGSEYDHLVGFPCPGCAPVNGGGIVERIFELRKPDVDAVLPTDREERKAIPLFSGVLNYFPLALAAVARHSKRGNDQHNPGQPLHWSRGKSNDHTDCIARHLLDVETRNPVSGEYEEATALAWRALAKLQELEEARLGKGPSRGSKVDPPTPTERPKWDEPGDDDGPKCGAV